MLTHLKCKIKNKLLLFVLLFLFVYIVDSTIIFEILNNDVKIKKLKQLFLHAKTIDFWILPKNLHSMSEFSN